MGVCYCSHTCIYRPADSLSPNGQTLGKMALAGSNGPRLNGGQRAPPEGKAKGTEHLADPWQQVTLATGQQTPCGEVIWGKN